MAAFLRNNHLDFPESWSRDCFQIKERWRCQAGFPAQEMQCHRNSEVDIRTPEVPSRLCYQKDQTKLHSFPQFFNHIFLQMSRKCVKCIQWRVGSGPIKRFVSWLHGPHQSRYPASKFRVLLAIWFCFFDSGNSIISGGTSWCPFYISYRSSNVCVNLLSNIYITGILLQLKFNHEMILNLWLTDNRRLFRDCESWVERGLEMDQCKSRLLKCKNRK